MAIMATLLPWTLLGQAGNSVVVDADANAEVDRCCKDRLIEHVAHHRKERDVVADALRANDTHRPVGHLPRPIARCADIDKSIIVLIAQCN